MVVIDWTVRVGSSFAWATEGGEIAKESLVVLEETKMEMGEVRPLRFHIPTVTV